MVKSMSQRWFIKNKRKIFFFDPTIKQVNSIHITFFLESNLYRLMFSMV